MPALAVLAVTDPLECFSGRLVCGIQESLQPTFFRAKPSLVDRFKNSVNVWA